MEDAVLTDRDKRSKPGPAPATPAPATRAPQAAPAPQAGGAPQGGGVTVQPDGSAGTDTPAEAENLPVSPVTTLAHAKASIPHWTFLPYAIVFAGVACGLAWTALGPRHVMNGLLGMASALLVAAGLRLVLPERRAGLLLSRRRLLDVLALASLGASIMALVLVLPAPA